jgi:hypothetical protein
MSGYQHLFEPMVGDYRWVPLWDNMFGLEDANVGHLLVSILGISGGWISVGTRFRSHRYDAINVVELAARSPFRHNMGMLVSFCLAAYALIIFSSIGYQYLIYDGSASVMFFSIHLEINSLGWYVVHLFGWSAFFAGSVFFGLQEMDIAYIHYEARAEVLRVPGAPSLPLFDQNGEPIEEPESEGLEEGSTEPEHLNPLERLWQKVERLEDRLRQLEDESKEEE